jgi:hypothetical protein
MDAYEKLNCQGGRFESKWTDNSTLVVHNPPFELEVKIKSSTEIEKPASNIFQFVWPKSYKVLNP